MKSISLNDAQKRLMELVDALEEGPVLLMRDGEACAGLVGLDEHFDWEAFSLGRNKAFRRLLDKACRQTARRGGIPFSTIVAKVDTPHGTGNRGRTRRR